MKPKSSVKDQLVHWQQKHLEAKTKGDTKLMKIYEALILKLGGKPLKI